MENPRPQEPPSGTRERGLITLLSRAVKWPVHRNGGLVTERNLSYRSSRLKSRPPHASIL